ncbi:sigma-70 factor domain-containing protein [Nostoc sp. LEGE 06077]|uniref:sigma-70 factor domain-containing protein n=1 Tax=Nostoc sp. LEGE 06077 TaxID=915325 RepID=UPI001D13DDDE|nr:sigma-70 factor domain-containing protein [Nostoc sp. LEGE 06077]
MSSLSSDLVRVYLQEIGQFPLLTSDQEITYARLVQQMMAIQQQKQQLSQQLHRQPTSIELANFVNKSEIEINQIFKQGHSLRSNSKLLIQNSKLRSWG